MDEGCKQRSRPLRSGEDKRFFPFFVKIWRFCGSNSHYGNFGDALIREDKDNRKKTEANEMKTKRRDEKMTAANERVTKSVVDAEPVKESKASKKPRGSKR